MNVTSLETFSLVAPEIVLVLAALVAYLGGAFAGLRFGWLVATAGIVAAMSVTRGQAADAAFSAGIAIDPFSTYIRWTVLALGLLLCLVQSGDLFAAVTGTKTGSSPITVSGPAMIPVGGCGKIVVSQRGQPAFNIKDTRLELRDPPDGVTLEGFSPCEGGIAITFRCTDKTKPGTRGNLLVETFGEKTTPGKDGAKPVTNRWPRGYLPAIEFEIVRP